VSKVRPTSIKTPILQLDQVRKVFSGDLFKSAQVALAGLSHELYPGRCSGLLGPNGAGKTTAIRLILGLVAPSSGRVLFNGRPLSTASKQFIGYMPDTSKLPGSLQVGEVLRHQLLLFASPHAASARQRQLCVEATLAAVGLSEHASKRISRLSKGMARRLAWAQATIHRPQLLILDEPASGLDPLARRAMLGWIQAEKVRGTTILLCTHELTQVTALCDDYLVLRRGELVASGTIAASTGFALHVSGLDEAGLSRLAASEELPPWRALRQDGFLVELGFVDYDGAAMWALALLRKGYVVTRFADDQRVIEEQLLSYFVGGE
jgi:ABC-2 type transport system ATP-binding protein